MKRAKVNQNQNLLGRIILKKKILTLGIVLALVMALVIPTAVVADNTGTQGASTTSAETLLIQNQDSSETVSVITFPAGTPGSTVSNPSNNAAVPEMQVFGAAGVAQPVVTLTNNAAVPYILWFNISTFANGVVASESYEILAEEAACLSDAAITNAVTFGTNTSTTTTITATTNMDLYLKVVLSSLAGKSGTSTITILGESP